MAEFSTTLQTKIAFFHAGGSRVLTEVNQSGPYESGLKSAHAVLGDKDVWADTVAYAVDVAAADAEAIANSAVTKFLQVDLTMYPGSNNQVFYYDLAGTFVKPWISPTDVPEPITAAPSYGYQMLLYQQDLTPIFLTDARWTTDYYAGIIQFETGFTPINMGYALPLKATLFVYTGNFGGGSGGIGSVPDYQLDGGPIIQVPPNGYFKLDGGSIV